jgi:predicted RNase H-like nuclease (RuvC/YqgF family)
MSAVVGVRVPEELKKELEELDIEYAEDVRRLLEEKVRRKRIEEAMRRLDETRSRIGRLEGDYATQVIREMRDRR